jgi:hypothetical protein
MSATRADKVAAMKWLLAQPQMAEAVERLQDRLSSWLEKRPDPFASRRRATRRPRG